MSDDPREPSIRGVDVDGPPEAQPIVFLHGVMFTRKLWAPQRDALAEEFRVLVPDFPGHGERADAEFGMEAALSLVDDVVETHADGSAMVVGLSLGGYVATAYARRYPEKVDALAISGSSANPVGALGTLTRIVSGTSNLVTKSDLVNRGISAVIERWVENRDLPRSIRAEIVDSGFYPKPNGDAGFELAGTDFRAAFAAYDGPALVLNGRWDLVNRLGEGKHADASTSTRVEVVNGAGHVSNLEQSEAFTDALHRFVLAAGAAGAAPGSGREGGRFGSD